MPIKTSWAKAKGRRLQQLVRDKISGIIPLNERRCSKHFYGRYRGRHFTLIGCEEAIPLLR